MIQSTYDRPSNYKARVRDRFKAEIKQIVDKYSLPELVLVLDLYSAFLLSNLFVLTDLVAMKIVYIERLEVKRKKMNHHAVYFVEATRDNGQLIIKDFPGEGEPQYRRIHLLFTSFVDKPILKEMALNPHLLKRIAKNSIKEFYHSNRVLAPNLLDLNLPYLAAAFSRDSASEALKRSLLARKIVEVVANTQGVNTVRVYYKKAENKICERMAGALEAEIKNYLGVLLKNKSPTLDRQAPDLTFLLLDRSIDTVTPLIHNFSYEALLFDLFSISMVAKSDLNDKGSYSYEEIQNSVYEEYRYKHLSTALERVPEALEEEKGKLQMLKTGTHETFSIKELDRTVSELKSNIEKLEMIWKEFKAQQLEQCAELEQSLATGLTCNAENTSSVKLLSEVQDWIRKPIASIDIKLRLALLCLSCIKLTKSDYQTLLSMFPGEEKKALKNVIALGVTYDDHLSKSTKTISKDQQSLAKKRMEETKMPLNRYTSIVELVLPLFCKVLSDPNKKQGLDKDVFGEVSCSVYRDNEQQEANRFKSNRLAMVMLGGLSWAEVSAIRQLKGLEDILVISDSLMNPSKYISELGKIDILKQ